ncbi:TspO/MBR family protein [Mesorhizobium sp. CN2-181]|uniref:TspO/MBR family protein n=1 Tax=Mesorhizobium yinganensis TaxID=3157707 RepID=UPI0032B703E3
MAGRVTLLWFLLLTVGGGTAIGLATAPGPWYDTLQKPAFNPPPWVFGPVWTVLYILIAIAGWRIWRVERDGILTKLWFAQLVVNFAWSPIFFSLHSIGLALPVILVLLVLIASFVVMAWRRDPIAAWLFIPYLAWVAFATLLNASLFALN